MRVLRKLVDTHSHRFEEGGRLARFAPVWEAAHSFFFTPGEVTEGAPHVRDGRDLKRVMATVVLALSGCAFMAMYNTGRQAGSAIAAGAAPIPGWRTTAMQALDLPFDPTDVGACIVHGALWFLPVFAVTVLVGIAWEILFAVVRRHPVQEGFFVTGPLFALIMPATIPLWQVALGISFGVVIGKEVFGGTGMNILNPALTGRAFLFFAYPAAISGDEVWVAAQTFAVDTVSGATPLAEAAQGQLRFDGGAPSWWDAFLGVIPGSMGETSALACMLGVLLLLLTGIASWRIVAGVILGTIGASLVFNAVGSETNSTFAMPFWWHFVLGGWAFGAAFMATDPVTAAQTQVGRWIYGLLIGVLVVVIRVANPGYPEAMMLAILLMNVFAATIDHFVVEANVRRRRRRRRGR